MIILFSSVYGSCFLVTVGPPLSLFTIKMANICQIRGAQYGAQWRVPKNFILHVFTLMLLPSSYRRFVSRSGWLSFTKPVDGSVYELPDNSYGMRRTEIRSVSSDIHLGHVFDDGPNGMPRYCINATVLEFVDRQSVSS